MHSNLIGAKGGPPMRTLRASEVHDDVTLAIIKGYTLGSMCDFDATGLFEAGVFALRAFRPVVSHDPASSCVELRPA
jgi:hypothetical protein